MGNSLFNSLSDFAKVLAQRTQVKKTEGKYSKRLITVIKPRVEVFDYATRMPQQTSYKEIDREEWDWHYVEDLNVLLESLAEYANCASQMTEHYDISADFAKGRLQRLAEAITRDVLINDDVLSDAYFNNQVMRFIRDLDNSPVQHSCKFWISGVRLEEDEIPLTNTLKFRLPQPVDFEEETLGIAGIDDGSRRQFSLLMEMSVICHKTNEAQDDADVLLDVLRLFGLSSVHIEKGQIYPQSLLRSGYRFVPRHHYATTYEYVFRAEDVSRLMFLHDKLKPSMLSATSIARRNDNPLGIAFNRYKEATLERQEIESRIALGISCLEALYLKASERMELTHRLSQRVAALLNYAGYEDKPLKAYADVKRAYDIRSTFVHGSPQEAENREKDRELCKMILDYARASLLIFLQLAEAQAKDAFINKLDNSLLDKNALRKLQSLLENIQVPKSQPS